MDVRYLKNSLFETQTEKAIFPISLFLKLKKKHCNSLERKCMGKVVSTSKITILEWNCRFFRRFFFIRNGFGYCRYKGSVSFCLNNHEIKSKSTDWPLTMRTWYITVSKFRNIPYKSPINSSIKPVHFFLTSWSTSSFFLGLLIPRKEHYISHLEAAGDRNVVLEH